jgi:DNA processing protein
LALLMRDLFSQSVTARCDADSALPIIRGSEVRSPAFPGITPRSYRMTLDEAVALSLTPNLLRIGLTARLRAGDPHLLEQASRRRVDAREVRLRADAAGIHAMAWNDPRFPAALLTISDAPPVIWYRGDPGAFAQPAIAVVGSRSASAVALEIAARLGGDLAARGAVVVSGLARGVDSAAHRGAIAKGRTIAVLGCGVDVVYPREHAALTAAIVERGIVMSEFPPGTPPLPFHFPLRNRLISGLSRAVVVIEASEQSGSLITAACALDQGREVMAVPGNVLSGRNKGGHALIRDGAKIVETAGDILEEFGWQPTFAACARDGSTDSIVTTCEDPILAVMRGGEAYELEALSATAGIDGVGLLPRLLELELQGLVQRVDGGRFMRSARPC